MIEALVFAAAADDRVRVLAHEGLPGAYTAVDVLIETSEERFAIPLPAVLPLREWLESEQSSDIDAVILPVIRENPSVSDWFMAGRSIA